LKNANHDKRIDHRSYARQGIDKIPSIKLGVAAYQMEKRGIRTERGDINRSIEITNKELRQLRARISKLEKWIAGESKKSEMPTLYDVVSGILNRQRLSRIARIKETAQMLIFLQENNIMDMDDLERKVNDMQGSFNSMRDNLKKVNRRIDTLNEHLRHGDNIVKHRKIKRHYNELYSEYESAQKSTGFGAKRKADKALEAANVFYEFHRAELTLYDASDKYIRNVLQKRYDPKKLPPIKKWRDELVAKTAERNLLYREYDVLKNETAKVEKIRYSVKEILKAETPEQSLRKSQDMQR
jgi:predicted nuclease with TOPRIM domain